MSSKEILLHLRKTRMIKFTLELIVVIVIIVIVDYNYITNMQKHV